MYENRYCSQDDFDIVICGGIKKIEGTTNEVMELKGPDFTTSVKLSPMHRSIYFCDTTVIGSEIYVLDVDNTSVNIPYSLGVYSKNTKHWREHIHLIDLGIYFSVCSFMKSVYVIGGYLGDVRYSKECLRYEIKNNKWTQIAPLKIKRCNSACTVFEGKIVATGGENYKGTLKSVESYDHYKKKWTSLSDMIGGKFEHSAINMGNKLFVISSVSYTSSEVYDNISRKFTLLNLKRHYTDPNFRSCKAVGISNKIYIFCSYFSNENIIMIYVYNVDENEWNSEEFVIADKLRPAAFQKHPKT